MEESYANLSGSHFVGSVPAAITEEKRITTPEVTGANLQTFPPTIGGGVGRGYQTLGDTSDASQQQPANNWKGFLSISSYTQYFNVDTDVVLNRLLSSLNPISGDFSRKIDANPDLYGLIWISTTLVFAVAAFGNCATYLMHKRDDSSSAWAFDVNFVNVAATAIYGYALIVPLGYYFLLQYLGSSVSLIHIWCMWGYSLFILILTSFVLIIPVEFVRWTVMLIAGVASASFVGLNLRSYIQSNDLAIVAASAFVLQLALSIFIKMWFFA